MANCLQLPMASSYSTFTSSSTSLFSPKRAPSIKTRRFINSFRDVSKIPMPPLNPNDPFLKDLASLIAASPEPLSKRRDGPPYLDLFHPPRAMYSNAEVDIVSTYRGPKRAKPPPDLPSILLDGRVVYIGMPLVPAVTELVISQLLYLQWASPEPIYIYLNSTGTTRDDGEVVAMESEGFAVYDAIMHMKNEIRTLCLGFAIGQACLLLSAGTKGKRIMLPHATAIIRQPKVPSSGLMQASDVAIRVQEVIANRDTLVRLLAEHTGNSEETITTALKGGSLVLSATEAKDFGVIDRVLRPQKKSLVANIISPVGWGDKGGNSGEDEGAAIKADDAI